MHDSSLDHWYLLFVDMLQGLAEIWDTKIQPNRKDQRREDCLAIVSLW